MSCKNNLKIICDKSDDRNIYYEMPESSFRFIELVFARFPTWHKHNYNITKLIPLLPQNIKETIVVKSA